MLFINSNGELSDINNNDGKYMCNDVHAQSWKEFIESEIGKKFLDISSLSNGINLYNRLWLAFEAGLKAGRKR